MPIRTGADGSWSVVEGVEITIRLQHLTGLFRGPMGHPVIAVALDKLGFFGKVFDPASSNSGNFDLGVLTALIGVAFIISLVGLTGSIMWKPEE